MPSKGSGGPGSTFKVFRSLAETFRIITKAAEAVVAVPAQKAANGLSLVAVIDRQDLDLAPTHQGLGLAANCAHAALRIVQCLPVAFGKPVSMLQCLLSEALGPILIGELGPHSFSVRSIGQSAAKLYFFFRNQTGSIHKIFDPAITRIPVLKCKIIRRLFSTNIDPHYSVGRESTRIYIDISPQRRWPHTFRASPIPSNVADFYSAVLRWVAPPQRQRLRRVIFKQIHKNVLGWAGHILTIHSTLEVANAK